MQANIVLGPASNVLVTGVTGLIGGEIVRRLAACSVGAVWGLVRSRDAEPPAARLADRLRRSGAGHLAPDIAAVAGDVTRPGWALAPRDRARITESVDVIIHSAANTSFVHDESVRDTNIAGTTHLIDLARQCHRPPLVVYVSTAANVGRTGVRCVREDDGGPANTPFNEYTRSKAVAEDLLRASGLPVLTVRPSIVLSAGLPDPEFAKAILWCVPLLRLFDRLPLDPASRVDVVDVDFVAAAVVGLARAAGRRHDCYHLSAGEAGGVTLREAAAFTDAHYRRRRPLDLCPPAAWTRLDTRRHVRTPLQRRVFATLRHYLPFLNMDVVYDDARLRAEAVAAEARPLFDYMGDLLHMIKPRRALLEAACP